MVRAVNRVFLPLMGCGTMARHTRGIKGRGIGGVLLNNGQGGSSGGSYNSVDDYVDITNRNPFVLSSAVPRVSGRGVSLERMNKKIESLMVRQKKPKNINFSL